MRRAGGALAVMLCMAAAGCANNPFYHLCIYAPPDPKPRHAVGGFGGAFGNSLALDTAPGVYVESVLLERALGDPALNGDIWTRDSSAIPPQTRVLLEENGLRVAVIGGNLPSQFKKLLESEEGAVNPQGLTFGIRTETVVPTVGPIPTCEFCVQAALSGERETKKLLAANGGFRIQPERVADGRVKLRCEPQVQHGERQDFIRPASDATGFTFQSEVPSERFESLGFDVHLGAGDYLVIGWSAADEGESHSLGSALFCVDAKSEPRQRILVLRAGYRGESPGDLPPVVRAGGLRPIAAHVNR